MSSPEIIYAFTDDYYLAKILSKNPKSSETEIGIFSVFTSTPRAADRVILCDGAFSSDYQIESNEVTQFIKIDSGGLTEFSQNLLNYQKSNASLTVHFHGEAEKDDENLSFEPVMGIPLKENGIVGHHTLFTSALAIMAKKLGYGALNVISCHSGAGLHKATLTTPPTTDKVKNISSLVEASRQSEIPIIINAGKYIVQTESHKVPSDSDLMGIFSKLETLFPGVSDDKLKKSRLLTLCELIYSITTAPNTKYLLFKGKVEKLKSPKLTLDLGEQTKENLRKATLFFAREIFRQTAEPDSAALEGIFKELMDLHFDKNHHASMIAVQQVVKNREESFADINYYNSTHPDFVAAEINKTSNTLLSVAMQRKLGISFKKLLELQTAEKVDSVDNPIDKEKEYRLLHLAAQLSLPEITKTLLENGANPKLLTEKGKNPLWIACRQKLSDEQLDCVKLLISAGSDIDLRVAKTITEGEAARSEEKSLVMFSHSRTQKHVLPEGQQKDLSDVTKALLCCGAKVTETEKEILIADSRPQVVERLLVCGEFNRILFEATGKRLMQEEIEPMIEGLLKKHVTADHSDFVEISYENLRAFISTLRTPETLKEAFLKEPGVPKPSIQIKTKTTEDAPGTSLSSPIATTATLYTLQDEEFKKTIWKDNERGGKFRVMGAGYTPEEITKIMEIILVTTASNIGLGKTGMTDVINYARQHGGVSNILTESGSYAKNTDSTINRKWKEYSAEVQKEFAKFGFFTGRQNPKKLVPLRLAFIPETVLENLKKRESVAITTEEGALMMEKMQDMGGATRT